VRRALLTAALLLAAPSTAAAAPFGELPFRAVSGAAYCVRATGMPGELVRWTSGGLELSTVPSGVFTPVRLGKVRECPEVVSDPGGFAALAVATDQGVKVALREPSGAWGTPTTFPVERSRAVRVAVSARGDVVVAWLDQPEAEIETSQTYVVRRVPGEPFGKPQRIGPALDNPELVVGVAGDGEAVLAIADRTRVRVTTGRPGAAFGATRDLGSTRSLSAALALAVAPDGHALLAAATGDGLALLDRAPGEDFVRRPALPIEALELAVGLGTERSGDERSARGSGSALVAAQSFGGLSVLRRAAGATMFGPVETVRSSVSGTNQGGALVSFLFGGDGRPYDGRPALDVLLGAGDRALVTWSVADLTAYATTLEPGSPPVTARVGSPLRDPQGVTPLLLADSRRAVAWSDNNAPVARRAFAGRVHVAVEGVADAPSAPPPTVEVLAPADRSLRPAQSLVLPVRCGAPCDLRIETSERLIDPGATLSRAGTARLRLFPTTRPLAPRRPGPLELRLVWSAPGAREVSQRTVAVPLRRASPPPFPRLLNVRATRRPGGVVDVRWTTDVPARDVGFRVAGDVRRAEREPDGGISIKGVEGDGRRRFRVRLTKAERVRYVRVNVYESFGRRDRRVTVPVR
jgi:hypothetical protein